MCLCVSALCVAFLLISINSAITKKAGSRNSWVIDRIFACRPCTSYNTTFFAPCRPVVIAILLLCVSFGCMGAQTTHTKPNPRPGVQKMTTSLWFHSTMTWRFFRYPGVAESCFTFGYDIHQLIHITLIVIWRKLFYNVAYRLVPVQSLICFVFK